jgi:hypothetical protein
LSALAEVLHRFDPPWIKMGRIYRRICFLRSEGRAEEARRLEETELAAAEMEAFGAGGPGPGAGLEDFLAEEEERVADAVAFAEVLVPALSERLHGMKQYSPPPDAPAPRAPRPAATGSERGIADFIDEMLAQERGRSD